MATSYKRSAIAPLKAATGRSRNSTTMATSHSMLPIPSAVGRATRLFVKRLGGECPRAVCTPATTYAKILSTLLKELPVFVYGTFGHSVQIFQGLRKKPPGRCDVRIYRVAASLRGYACLRLTYSMRIRVRIYVVSELNTRGDVRRSGSAARCEPIGERP